MDRQYYGALKTGAVINPVNVMLTPAEVAYVARDCGAKILIGSPEKIGPSLAAGLTGLKAIVFGKTPVPGTTAFNELVAKAAAFEPIAVDPQALSTIGYTSGTTGHPKGAMQSHRAVILNAAMTVRAARLAARPCRSQRGREAFRLSPHRIVGHDGVGGPRYDVMWCSNRARPLTPKTSSLSAAKTLLLTKCRGRCNSCPICRKRRPVKSCDASCASWMLEE
jgi:acyl-CoA synthetase (AMP-forming)/AMP-acid ligase II